MTEQEWLTCDDPQRMLAVMMPVSLGDADTGWAMTYGKQRISDRKLRLFACACHAASMQRPTRAYGHMAVDGEKYSGNSEIEGDAAFMARIWCEPGLGQQQTPAWGSNIPSQAMKAALLREIVGNPFQPRPVPELLPARCPGFDHEFRFPWLTPVTWAIATRIYTEGDWAAMPVLADALEDAGCTERAILMHLRSHQLVPRPNTGNPPLSWYEPTPMVHVRGCWAVDLILGKE